MTKFYKESDVKILIEALQDSIDSGYDQANHSANALEAFAEVEPVLEPANISDPVEGIRFTLGAECENARIRKLMEGEGKQCVV